jgi:hypothetical protein
VTATIEDKEPISTGTRSATPSNRSRSVGIARVGTRIIGIVVLRWRADGRQPARRGALASIVERVLHDEFRRVGH